MKMLADLFLHNAWANYHILEHFQKAESVLDLLAYDGEPLRTRAQHLVTVETGFLHLLLRDARVPDVGADLPGLLARAHATGSDLCQEAERLQEGDLRMPFYVPWWGHEFPAAVLFAQVLAHSGQHRAELAWELARAYIGWEPGGRPAPGQPLVFPAELQG